MNTSYISFSLFVILAVSLGLVSSQCNTTAYGTYAYTLNKTYVSLKSNSTHKLRIGLLGGLYFGDTMQRTIGSVITYQLNNDLSILPDVEVEFYWSSIRSTSDILLATMFYINQLKVHGLIAGFSSTDARTAQLAAKIYNIPHTSSLASSYSLSNKDEYPYFLRTYPSDTVQILSILSLFKKFNWKKALIVYTYDDYGSAYTRLTSAGADQNITFSSIGVSPDAANATYSNVNSTVDSVFQAIEQQEFRIIIYYAQYYPSLAIMTELHNRGIKGGDYVSILTTSMGASFGSPFPWYEGAIAFTSPVPKGPFLDNIYTKWTTDPGNPFPRLPKASLQIGWFAVDAILNYVYTYDKLMKRGMAFDNIKGRMLYQEMINNTFEGATGNVGFDEMGDRLMSYSVISLVGNGTQVDAGYYDPDLDDFVQTGPFVWAGGRTTVPRDSPYKCLACGHGTCVVDVGCVCFPGYYGEGCYEKDEKSNTSFIIGISVGLVAALAVALILVFFVYRRKRYQLVQEVADKQRSKLSRSDINMQKRIGRGASGEVFKASFRGTEVAVKKIITTTVDKSVIREFELEVAIMCGLRHPNIILFMGSCFDIENKEMLLVMEFMAKGSLHDVLHNNTITLNYDMMLHLALQAAQGMNFLHQSTPPIIHQDLKSHNILLDDKWNARISDFGITKFQDKNHKLHKASKADSAIGTVYWSSPEILEGLETTEKSDCYSFGVVLWEIFHRQNPYEGRDPISVALDVMHGNVRPRINPQVPVEMQDLMTRCWEKSPKQRPSFEEIVTVLRECSMKNPSYSVGGGGSNMRTQAPSGKVYIVNTTVSDPYTLWENCPTDMQESMRCHNNLLRGNIDMYRGYEARCDELHSFTVMFHTLQDAVDFSISTQISLMHVDWPQPILSYPCCQEVMYGETLLWKGLRVRMSIFSGVPNCELDPLTGRMNYIGPVVESAQKLLKKTRGYISISDPVMSEITRIAPNFIQEITTKKQGDMFDTSRNETQSIHTVSIKSLSERENVTMLEDLNKDQLHVLLDVNEMETLGRSNSCNFDDKSPNWIITYKEMEVKHSIGKGAMGDYYLALLNGKEVALKLLINQKIKEDDMLKLMKDSSVMSKINHPNLLKFHGMCLEEDSLASISEFMPKGNLKVMLADQSITISLQQKMKIALDIANGLRYLSEVDDEEIKAHSNLKSYNILIGKDMEAKVADYGHRSLRELARTMTSIGSVAWTAPEMLSGDDQISPKISVYSFGMICWEIYTRQVPYVDQHPIRVVSKILEGYRPALPTNCPPNISQLITSCLSGRPDDRPSWDVIISTLSDIIRNI